MPCVMSEGAVYPLPTASTLQAAPWSFGTKNAAQDDNSGLQENKRDLTASPPVTMITPKTRRLAVFPQCAWRVTVLLYFITLPRAGSRGL